MRKKRILFNSNHSRLYTGFGKNTKNLLSYLYSTGKYEIMEYCAGMRWSSPELRFLPWKANGSLPDNPAEINELNRDPLKARNASYGEYNVERAVKEFKPDVCFFVEDAWGVTFNTSKSFWNKIPCVLWVTQDSLPLIHADDAKKTPYYWCWSSFAEREFHRLGTTTVKTQYPLVDLKNFSKLPDSKIREIRHRFNISDDTFVITQVCRNQLRKLFPNQIEGYAMFKKQNPEVKSILLLVTSFSEGWDIMRLADQYGVPKNEIYAAYVSHETGDYAVAPFQGNDLKCPWSGKEKAVQTVNIVKGVSEEQLNEIYNISDVISHPATSGACELPLVEAAAAEKILITVDYSYGEDIFPSNKAAIKLDWAKYTEIGTQFIKSSPYPFSIAKSFKKVYDMGRQKRVELGKSSREWAMAKYDMMKNGKIIEDFIDSLPEADWEKISLSQNKKNDSFPMPKESMLDIDFISILYKEVLLMDEPVHGDGHKHWQAALKNGLSRQNVYDYFISVAKQENQKSNPDQQDSFESLLDKTGRKRALFLIKESIGDCYLTTSLFESFHKHYKDCDLYVACEPKFSQVFLGNPDVYKVIPYHPFMENELAIIGQGPNKGYFDYYFHPGIRTQRQLDYLSHQEPSFNIKV